LGELHLESGDDVPGTNGGYGDVIIHADWTLDVLLG
jgi:hypothetical protein